MKNLTTWKARLAGVGLLALLAAGAARAQSPGVGIGTATPNGAAALDISSTSKGLLLPRLSTAQRDAITATGLPGGPALGLAQAGLQIYNTNTNALNVWDGTNWVAVIAGGAEATAANTTSYGPLAGGGAQTYTVPAGVTRLLVIAQGAAGGDGNSSVGGRTSATLAVVPGEVLTLVVGRRDGYNGGGSARSGWNGGGATDIRRIAGATALAPFGSSGTVLSTLAQRLLVAGGAGGNTNRGKGGGGSAVGSLGVGGEGASGFPDGSSGGATGGAGGAGGGDGGGGGGGGLSSGGGGGTGPVAGGSGGLGLGGNANASTGGGGGGGGYYGGGAGAGGSSNGGGAGGSSWVGSPAPGTAPAFGFAGSLADGTLAVSAVSPVQAPVLDASNFANLPGRNLAAGAVPFSNGTTLVGDAANFSYDGTNNRLGLGLNTPLQPLHIQAGTPLTGTNTGTAPQMRLERVGTSGTKWNSSAELAVGTYATGINSQSQLNFNLGQNANANADQTVLTLRGDGRVVVPGTLQLTGGTLGVGRVLTSDANGNATWQPATGGGGSQTLSVTGQTLAISGGNTVTLPSGGADNLGNHTATTNLNLAANQLVGNGGTAGLAISSTGRVGIGTASPAYLLHVADAIHSSGTNGQLSFEDRADATKRFAWYADAQGAKLFHNVGGDLLNVTAGGNVGLGTTAPTQKLDVAGTTRTTGLQTGTLQLTGGTLGAGRILTSDAAGNATWQPAAGGSDNLGNHTATTNLNLAANQLVGNGGTSGLAISNGGNVGVGTTAPAARLDVTGTLRVGQAATTIVSQLNSTGASNGLGGQSFTVPTGTTVAEIDVYVFGGSGAFTVYEGAGFGGPVRSTQTVAYTGGYGLTTVTLATPILSTGAGVYTLRVQGSSFLSFSTGNLYAGGVVYNIVGTAGSSDDLQFAVRSTPSTNLNVAASGNVGIGTSTPQQALDVAGTTRTTGLQLTGGTLGAGRVLTSDAAGNATWQPATGGTDAQTLTLTGQNLAISNGNSVTLPASPAQTLTLTGQSLAISGGNSVTLPATATATNGLSATGGQVSLGGTLTQTTTTVDVNTKTLSFANGAANALSIASGNVAVDGPLKISSGSPGAGKVLVSDAAGNATWGTAAAGVITANNGLTNTSGTIALGGSLNQNTTLALGSNSLTLGTAGAGVSIFSVSPGSTASVSPTSASNAQWQSFTTTSALVPTAAAFLVNGTGSTASTFTLELRAGTGTGGTLLGSLGSGSVTSATPAYVQVPLSGVSLASGQVYSLVLRVTSAAAVTLTAGPDAYAGGTAGQGASTPYASNDFNLQLFGPGPGAGLVIAPSGITSDLSLRLPLGAAVSEFSTDGTLAGNADNAVPTEKAVKTYVDAAVVTAPQPWTVAGANVYRAGGNVGIGTTAPANRLGVVSADNLPGTDIASFVAANGTAGVGLGWNGLRAIGTNGSNSLSLDSKGTGNLLLQTGGGTGNVGIGAANPLTPLSITPAAAGAKITLFDNGDANNHLGFGVSASQLNYHVANATNDHVFYAGGKAGPSASATELLRVKGSGNVGIGTATPATRLEVRGTPIGNTTANPLTPQPLLRMSRLGISGQKYDAGFEMTLGSYSNATQSASQVDFNLGDGNNFNLDRTAMTLYGDGEVQVDGRLRMGAPIDRNIFIGLDAGRITTRGNDGSDSTRSNPATSNLFVGDWSGFNNTVGAQNTFTGSLSGVNNSTGSANTAVGRVAGANNTTGNANVYVGSRAGLGNNTGSLTTFVGHSTTSGPANLSNATAIGARAQVDASNSMVLGSIAGVNGAASNTRVGVGVTAPNSRLQLNGAISMPSKSTTVAGNYVYGFNDYMVRFASPVTTPIFPNAADCRGRIYIMWNLSGATLTFGSFGGDVVWIDYTVRSSIPNARMWTVQSDGSNWVIIAELR